MKKVIETAIPLRYINESSIADKARKSHPANLHLWWNRSPIASSSAILYAVLSDWSDKEEEQKRIVDTIKGLAQGNQVTYEEVCRELKNKKVPTIVDNMSGYGGLAYSAEQLGCSVYCGDLNALATLLTKAITEFPTKNKDVKAIHPSINGAKNSSCGLADDIFYYGKLLGERVETKLEQYYPKEGDVDCFAWIWTRTVECPNPACKCQMPLSSSFELTKNKGKEFWAEPVYEGTKLSFNIHKGQCPDGNKSNKLGNIGAKFKCPKCGEIATDEYVKKKGKEHLIGMQMIAAVKMVDKNKGYVSPSDVQMKASIIKKNEDKIVGSIPNNTRWFSPPGFGFTEYSDLFTDRQLFMLTTFCNTLNEIKPEIENDVKNAGINAPEYAKSIITYLAIAISKMANYHSTICTWDNRNGIGRAAFTRQAIPMTWTFVEENPFSTATGNYEAMLKSVVDVVDSLVNVGNANVSMENALSAKLPKGCSLFVELPYYDFFGYADLSDYFYIWLRKSLKDVIPDLFEKIVTSKEELASIPEHYGNDAVKAKKEYRKGVEQYFVNIAKYVSSEVPSIIFYEYTKVDEAAISSLEIGEMELSPFEYIISAMRQSGLSVSAVWPVRTEKSREDFDSVRVAIVFRKSDNGDEQTTRRSFINVLKRELYGTIVPILHSETDESDYQLSVMGKGISIYARYKNILNADGSPMSVHDAMQVIYQEAKDQIQNYEDAIEQGLASSEEE